MKADRCRWPNCEVLLELNPSIASHEVGSMPVSSWTVTRSGMYQQMVALKKLFLAMSGIVECLLLAPSGHLRRSQRVRLQGVKRTSLIRALMSANDPKRTWPLTEMPTAAWYNDRHLQIGRDA